MVLESVDICPICHCKDIESNRDFTTDSWTIICETCGKYQITDTALVNAQSERPKDSHLLSGVLRNSWERGTHQQIDTINLSQLSKNAPRFTSLTEPMDRLLVWVSQKGKYLGDYVHLRATNEYPIVYSKNPEEFSFLLQSLKAAGYLENPGNGKYRLTVKGWERITEKSLAISDTGQAFVAMWFDDEMEKVWEQGFYPAIDDAGYQPYRIDLVEHNQKIDDRIIAEIRNSSLLVADFTGHRGGVYFEAGYALGLGIPVIWTCRKDHLEAAHFDTRQYNHIDWESPAELRQRLFNRIRATHPRMK